MNRVQLKERGKAAFKANYWVCVLVALLLSLAIGGFGGAVGGSSAGNINSSDVEVTQTASDIDLTAYDDLGIEDDPTAILNETEEQADAVEVVQENAGVLGAVAGISFVIALFVLGPLEVGCRSFFLKNLDAKQSASEIKTGFTKNYARNVGSIFLRDLFEVLWSILLLVPGIIMTYAYAMVPYLLAEDENLGAMEAIKKSKELMKGHKWDLFVLDISFILWFLLEVITAGLVGIFYSNPYIFSTHAAFYDALKKGELA